MQSSAKLPMPCPSLLGCHWRHRAQHWVDHVLLDVLIIRGKIARMFWALKRWHVAFVVVQWSSSREQWCQRWESSTSWCPHHQREHQEHLHQSMPELATGSMQRNQPYLSPIHAPTQSPSLHLPSPWLQALASTSLGRFHHFDCPSSSSTSFFKTQASAQLLVALHKHAFSLSHAWRTL